MTKEKLLLFILCLISWPLFSQYSRYYENDFYSENYHAGSPNAYKLGVIDSFALKHQINRIEYSLSTFNNKQTRKFIIVSKDVFDRNGRMVEQMSLLDTGKKQRIGRSSTRNFNEFGKVTYSSHFFYGRNYFKMFEYNDSQQLIKQVNYNKKGVYSIIETMYGSGDLFQSRIYKDRKKRVISTYHYLYYPNKQFRQVVLTNKKGKIIKVWDYSCDETGKSLKKLKDTARICTLKSYLPDGSVVTTTQSFDYYGNPWKTVTQVNANGRTTNEEYYSGKKEKLSYKEENTYVNDKLERTTTNHYYGHSNYKREIAYDTAGRIVSHISTIYKNGAKRKVYRTEYIYDHEGLITEKNTFLNDKLKTSERFMYEYYK